MKEVPADGWKQAAEYWYTEFRISKFGEDQRKMNFRGSLDKWIQHFYWPENALNEEKND